MKSAAGEHERDGEPERVDGEERGALEHRVRRAREHEDRGEHRADARRGADGERAAEQHARPAPPRFLHETGSDEALGPRQEAHEREPEHHQDEARDPLEQELIAEDPSADQRRADSEQHEERREADDERHAARDDPARGPRLSEPIGVDGRDRREVRGDERQHARREERDHPGEERDRDRRPAHVLVRKSRICGSRSEIATTPKAAADAAGDR